EHGDAARRIAADDVAGAGAADPDANRRCAGAERADDDAVDVAERDEAGVIGADEVVLHHAAVAADADPGVAEARYEVPAGKRRSADVAARSAGRDSDARAGRAWESDRTARVRADEVAGDDAVGAAGREGNLHAVEAVDDDSAQCAASAAD